MKLPDLGFINQFTDIPQQFYSDATSKPFDHCIACHQSLLQPGNLYMIEKAIRNYENFNTQDTIFEYAICLNCAQEMRETLSEVSRLRIDAYFDERVDLLERRQRFLDKNDLNPETWLSTCLIKGTPARQLSEYQIYCQCDGEHMLFAYMPFMIGGDVLEEMQELLSKKTRDELGGFMDRHLGLPPDLKKLLRDKPVLLV